MEPEVQQEQLHQMPSYAQLFEQVLPAPSEFSLRGVTKLAGTGDSGKKRSSRKAPGGRDSRKQKDGG